MFRKEWGAQYLPICLLHCWPHASLHRGETNRRYPLPSGILREWWEKWQYMSKSLVLLYRLQVSKEIVKNLWKRDSCSVTKSCLPLQLHELKHARLPCPSLSPGVCSNSHPLSQWCHSTVSSSITPFSSYPESFLAIRVFSNESAPHIRWSR